MNNDIANAELLHKTFVIKPQFDNEKEEDRTYYATGGNGCMPNALGTKIYVRNVKTGEEGFVRREDIVKMVPDVDPLTIPAVLQYIGHDKGDTNTVELCFSNGVKITVARSSVFGLGNALSNWAYNHKGD